MTKLKHLKTSLLVGLLATLLTLLVALTPSAIPRLQANSKPPVASIATLTTTSNNVVHNAFELRLNGKEYWTPTSSFVELSNVAFYAGGMYACPLAYGLYNYYFAGCCYGSFNSNEFVIYSFDVYFKLTIVDKNFVETGFWNNGECAFTCFIHDNAGTGRYFNDLVSLHWYFFGHINYVFYSQKVTAIIKVTYVFVDEYGNDLEWVYNEYHSTPIVFYTLDPPYDSNYVLITFYVDGAIWYTMLVPRGTILKAND